MPTDLVLNVSRIREENPALRWLQEFRSVLEQESFAGIAIFAGIALLAGLVAAICGVQGVWF